MSSRTTAVAIAATCTGLLLIGSLNRGAAARNADAVAEVSAKLDREITVPTALDLLPAPMWPRLQETITAIVAYRAGRGGARLCIGDGWRPESFPAGSLCSADEADSVPHVVVAATAMPVNDRRRPLLDGAGLSFYGAGGGDTMASGGGAAAGTAGEGGGGGGGNTIVGSSPR